MPPPKPRTVYEALGANFRVFYPKGKTTIPKRKLTAAVKRVVKGIKDANK